MFFNTFAVFFWIVIQLNSNIHLFEDEKSFITQNNHTIKTVEQINNEAMCNPMWVPLELWLSHQLPWSFTITSFSEMGNMTFSDDLWEFYVYRNCKMLLKYIDFMRIILTRFHIYFSELQNMNSIQKSYPRKFCEMKYVFSI